MRHEEEVWKEIIKLCPSRQNDIEELKFMAHYKFDSYEGYRTGDRFASNLLRFLSNFSQSERDDVVEMVSKIIFLSSKEMHELSMEVFFKIKLKILDIILEEKAHELKSWEYGKAYDRHYEAFSQKCLFVALSDSSKIDYFRRHALIDNESIVSWYKVDIVGLIKEGEDNEERNPHADYKSKEYIFLLDDFSGSGYTFLKQLEKFHNRWFKHIKYKNLFFCPYVITETAQEKILNEYGSRLPASDNVRFEIMPTLVIPKNHTISYDGCSLFAGESGTRRKNIMNLCEKYYHESIEDVHTKKNGGVKYGFGNSGLLLVKHDNCPNDSLFLLWFKDQVSSTQLKEWKPLFPRIPRHKNLK